MAVINRLLNDILRPKNLDQIILLDRIRKAVSGGKITQNFLLESPSPGTGKCVTSDTMVKIRYKDTGKEEYIQISELF
jgi:hypothetical protein